MAAKFIVPHLSPHSLRGSISTRSASFLLARPAPQDRNRHRCLHTTPPRKGGQSASFPWIQQPSTRGLDSREVRKVIGYIERLSKSEAVQAAEIMDEGGVPTDIGLLFSTLILDRSNKPQLSVLNKGFWSYHSNRILKRFREFGSLFIMKYYLGWRKTKLDLRSRANEAQKLHRVLNAAFASNDTGVLRNIALDGTRDRLQARMFSRPHNIKYEWELHKYNAKPKVMSDRAMMARMSEDQKEEYPFVRQVVVKIDSTQSLLRMEEGQLKHEAERIVDQRQLIEYVVVQQNWDENQPGEWKIWGTTEPTPPDQVLEAASDTTGQAKYQSMSDRTPGK